MSVLFRCLVFLLLLSVPRAVMSQDVRGWEQYLHELATLEEFDSDNVAELYDELCELEQNPININSATRRDLERIPFLTARQIEDISAHIYFNGAMKTLGELAMIESIDYNRRHLLAFFVYAGEEPGKAFPSMESLMRHGRHRLIATARVPFYKRRGDSNGYTGYPYKHWFRYEFAYGDRVRLGLSGSQDAGEPFFVSPNSLGYDFYSFYLQLRRLGGFDNIVLGRYRASFGMGLVVNNNFSLGKFSALASLGRKSGGVRGVASRSSSSYFQGAAATVRFGRFDATAFASFRPLDATLNDDGTVATILKTGYHRTPTELEKKNNTYMTTAGANLQYHKGALTLGATASYTRYSRDLAPDTKAVYRRYYASGNDFFNAGVTYAFVLPRIAVRGETAVSRNGSLATANSLSYSPLSNLDMMLFHRYYMRDYTAPTASCFSEGGRVQNEHGIYFGVSYRPLPRLSLSYYSDFAYFVWPRYQVSQSSRASDHTLQASWSPGVLTFSGRYRLHIRQRDDDSRRNLLSRTSHSGRLAVAASLPSGFLCRLQGDVAHVDFRRRDFGYMLSAEAVYGTGSGLTASLSARYFNTDSYESRIYGYERAPLYDFSSSAFYGEGIRYSLFLTAPLLRDLLLTVKFGVLDYFDRPSIGSGYQQIARSSKSDVDVQVRWRF